jgi:murein DD-endopeptidase MepM/ murein hydrolase activator NlpD
VLFIFNVKPVNATSIDSLIAEVFDAGTSLSQQKNLIEKMNKEELSFLVDYLMDLDTIPPNLIQEIQLAAINVSATRSIYSDESKADKSEVPASDLYSCWEINNLFPEKDMLKLKGDTSLTLVLSGVDQGRYTHPFNGPVTSTFGWRDSAQHKGIDIDLNRGDKVVVAFDGMVRVAKRYGGFGNVVIVRHYNGLETVYAHLYKIKVKPGQIVKSGDLIGLGGSTGHSTGTHLHFEVRFKGVPLNPQYLISFKNQELLCDELVIKKTRYGLAAYPKDMKIYTVEKGDTLFELAKRFGTTTASIRQLNGLTGRIRLRAGQQLSVLQ